MAKKQETNVTQEQPKTYDFRFTITVTTLQESEVKDNKTGKVYKCKNVWYTRNDTRRFYVNVAAVQGRQMKDMFSFPWQATILENGKLRGKNPVGMVHETNLAGKQSALVTEDMFE